MKDAKIWRIFWNQIPFWQNWIWVSNSNFLRFILIIYSNILKTKKKLANNKITQEGCSHLCESLQNNYSLFSLNLNQNEIKDEGCRYFSQAFDKNKNLKLSELDLSSFFFSCFFCLFKPNHYSKIEKVANRIGPSGCLFLAHILQKSENETDLSILNLGSSFVFSLENYRKFNTTCMYK